MAGALSLFTILPGNDGYVISIEDEDGETFEVTASFEQLDLIAEEIDRQLDGDEEEALAADPDAQE